MTNDKAQNSNLPASPEPTRLPSPPGIHLRHSRPACVRVPKTRGLRKLACARATRLPLQGTSGQVAGRWRAGQAQNPNDKTKLLAFRHLDFIWHWGFDILIITILFLSFTSFAYASPFKGPWGQDRPGEISQKQRDHRFNPMRSLVEVYRTYISPIDGSKCPMYPTCSKYSLVAFKKHGLFIGWMMTVDRLFRCGRDELRLSPQIIVNGELACYDPLENNDFWWYNGR